MISPNPSQNSCISSPLEHLAFMLARSSASTVFPLLLTLSASGGVIEVGASRDTTLYESATGAIGNGSGQFLFAGTTNQPQLRRAIFAFEPNSLLPENAIVLGVSLRLHLASTSTLSSHLSLHRVHSNWSEGPSDAAGNEGSGAPALVGDATWIHSSNPGSLWNTPGGDFDPNSIGSAIVGDVGFYSWTSADMLSDVQAWIKNPQSSFGWMLRGDESTAGTARRFDSSESLDSSLVPTLVIEYTLVPAPGAIALLLLSTAFAKPTRRRRA